MINKLVVRNFQRHKKLVIRFGRITTLIGPSDAGKSAIVRALRWSLLNRPSGTGFLRRGATGCRAAVSVDEHRITRSRRKSCNLYKLDDQEYTAFGNNVPDPVAEVANVCEDNFQNQHDAPFWLGLSPGELSRALNEVVDLEVIDRTLRNLNREVRASKSTMEVTRERLKEAKVERKRLADVPAIDAELVAVETQLEQAAAIRGKAIRLRGTIDEVADEQVAVKRIRKVVDQASPELISIEKMQQACGRAGELVDSLSDAIDQVAEREAAIAELSNELAEAEAALGEFDSCPWCGSEIKCDH